MRSWWGRGFPQALSVRAWVVALPAWLLMTGAAALSRSDGAVIQRLGFALCGFLVAGLVLLVFEPATRGSSKVARRVVTLLAWALAGLAAIGTTALLVRLAGLEASVWRPGMLLIGAGMALAWFPLGGRLASEIAEDAKSRALLLRQLARERALALESARLVDADRLRVIHQTQAVVGEQLRKAVDLSSDPPAAAAALQAVVDEVVRPLSRELERGEVEEQALVEAVHTMGQVSARPMRDFLPELARPRPGTVAMTGLRIALAVGIVFVAASTEPPLVSWIVVTVLAAYAIVMGAALTLAEARTRASENDLTAAVEAAEWASSRLRQLAWAERERLGKTIHGEAQARIVATALQIQLGKQDDIAERVEALEDDIHDLLAEHEFDQDWRSVWERIVKVWEYSVDVDASVDEHACIALDADPVAAFAVVSVLREAVTNAVRHAKARHLDLDLSVDQMDVLRFVIADNGTGNSTDDQTGEPGLGSRTLDAACLDWHLATHAVGHTLVARIPIARPSHA